MEIAEDGSSECYGYISLIRHFGDAVLDDSLQKHERSKLRQM
jgi:hypothetical protein